MNFQDSFQKMQMQAMIDQLKHENRILKIDLRRLYKKLLPHLTGRDKDKWNQLEIDFAIRNGYMQRQTSQSGGG